MKYSNFETIKTTFEFQNVYNNGASFANRDFVMYVAKNDWGCQSVKRLAIVLQDTDFQD